MKMPRLAMVAVLCVLFAVLSPVAKAANTKSGITLAPPFQEVLVLPNQSEVPGSFAVANNNDQPATFHLSTVDMGALDETGGVVFSGLAADYQQKYGLAHWLKLETDTLTLPPKTAQNVSFAIQNTPDLSPGGHYGAIIIKADAGQSTNQVSLSPQAASLLFARKVGGERYSLSLDTPQNMTALWSLPKQLTLTFRNQGNVHLVPRGYVTVNDPKGHEVAKGIINPQSAIILPEHSRTYIVDMQQTKQALRPGSYRAEISYRYDGSGDFATAGFKISYYGELFFGVLVAVSLAAVFLLSRLLKKWAPGWKLPVVKLPKIGKPISPPTPKPAAKHTYMSMRSLDRKPPNVPKSTQPKRSKSRKKTKK